MIRNRPFGMVVSPSFPVPTTCLLDFEIAQKLSLPMSDRQYKKFSYNGRVLRSVGRVSITAQCIKSGTLSGDIHVKAMVVLDLSNRGWRMRRIAEFAIMIAFAERVKKIVKVKIKTRRE